MKRIFLFTPAVAQAGILLLNEMPPQADLKDEEIAAVLSYVRISFGNRASAVSALQKKVRAAK
ncbi:c-type cytochrome [Deminuibacter soli]|uniref:c-type cytochrome n=1 Tax=Deminuibacter soli TaxID=2291815 RepID=UPI001B86B1BF|nr:hypothetical protein [Deminuibacter soli]